MQYLLNTVRLVVLLLICVPFASGKNSEVYELSYVDANEKNVKRHSLRLDLDMRSLTNKCSIIWDESIVTWGTSKPLNADRYTRIASTISLARCHEIRELLGSKATTHFRPHQLTLDEFAANPQQRLRYETIMSLADEITANHRAASVSVRYFVTDSDVAKPMELWGRQLEQKGKQFEGRRIRVSGYLTRAFERNTFRVPLEPGRRGPYVALALGDRSHLKRFDSVDVLFNVTNLPVTVEGILGHWREEPDPALGVSASIRRITSVEQWETRITPLTNDIPSTPETE